MEPEVEASRAVQVSQEVAGGRCLVEPDNERGGDPSTLKQGSPKEVNGRNECMAAS